MPRQPEIREPIAAEQVEIHPISPERWDDFVALFGPTGACAGCWCTFWLRSGRGGLSSDDNKTAIHDLIDDGATPGLLAYVDGQPAGWVALAPRENYPRLERSRKLKRVDEQPVWSIVCYYVGRPYRKRGLMSHLLSAAIAYARDHGAEIVEGYPMEVEAGHKLSGDGGYVGIASVYRDAGFVEVARPTASQAIMRLEL